MSFLALVLPLAGYLAGSISSAIFVSHLLGLQDPRLGGSGNPGATNVLRLGSRKAAALTLAGDLLKGLIPVGVAVGLEMETFIIATTGLGAFLGHLYPVYFGFRGGKGVATAAGIYLVISWVALLILLGCWLAVFLVSRYSSVAALAAAIAAPCIFLFLGESPYYVVLASVITLLLFWRHRANIGRLMRGEEGQIQ